MINVHQLEDGYDPADEPPENYRDYERMLLRELATPLGVHHATDAREYLARFEQVFGLRSAYRQPFSWRWAGTGWIAAKKNEEPKMLCSSHVVGHLLRDHTVSAQRTGYTTVVAVDLDYHHATKLWSREAARRQLPHDLAAVTAALNNVVGIPIRSSDSGGAHVYYFLDRAEPVEDVHQRVSAALALTDLDHAEVRPAPGCALRLPFGEGSFLVRPDRPTTPMHVRFKEGRLVCDLRATLDHVFEEAERCRVSLDRLTAGPGIVYAPIRQLGNLVTFGEPAPPTCTLVAAPHRKCTPLVSNTVGAARSDQEGVKADGRAVPRPGSADGLCFPTAVGKRASSPSRVQALVDYASVEAAGFSKGNSWREHRHWVNERLWRGETVAQVQAALAPKLAQLPPARARDMHNGVTRLATAMGKRRPRQHQQGATTSSPRITYKGGAFTVRYGKKWRKRLVAELPAQVHTLVMATEADPWTKDKALVLLAAVLARGPEGGSVIISKNVLKSIVGTRGPRGCGALYRRPLLLLEGLGLLRQIGNWKKGVHGRIYEVLPPPVVA